MTKSKKSRRANTRAAHLPAPSVLATALLLACSSVHAVTQADASPEQARQGCEMSDSSFTETLAATQEGTSCLTASAALTVIAPFSATQGVEAALWASERHGSFIVVDNVDVADAAAVTDDIGLGSIAVGSGASAAKGGTAIGEGALGDRGVAIGKFARTDGINALAIGDAASAETWGVAVGRDAAAKAASSVAFGSGARVDAGADSAVALGSSSVASVGRTVSVGREGFERKIMNVAAGTSDTDAVNLQQMQVAIMEDGLVSYDDASGVVSVAAGQAGGHVDFTGTDGSRRLVGVANGVVESGSTDAVNGSQLHGVEARTVENHGNIKLINSSLTLLDGRVQTNEGDIYTLYNQVGALSDGTAGLVTHDDETGVVSVATGKPGTTVNFAGTDGARVLTGVAAGDLSETSTEAVNGAQLFDTNERVSTNETNIDTINTTINEISAGTAGLVIYDEAEGVVSVAADKAGTMVNFAGTAGSRVLSGVAAGELNETSTEAVNGAQLFDTNERVSTNETNIDTINTTINEISAGTAGLVIYDEAEGVVSVAADKTGTMVNFAGTAGSRVLSGVAAGNLSEASTEAVNGAQLFDTNERVTANEGRINTIEGDINTINTTINDLSSGTAGLVIYDEAEGVVSVAADKAGTMVNFAGTAGARVLTGVAAGELSKDSTEAVNGAQLFDTNARVSTNETNIDTINTTINDLSSGTAGLVIYDEAEGVVSVAANKAGTMVNFAGTAGARVLTGVAAGDLSETSTEAVNGAQLFDTNARVSTNETNIDTINATINEISAGTAGLVIYDEAEGVVSVAADKAGTMVNFAGTAGARVLTGVAAGDLSETSTEAVNGAQLFDTNKRVTANETNINTINNTINELSGGTGGLVTYDEAEGVVSVAAGKAGNMVNFAGTAGARVLTGVAAGDLGKDSTDAVNGAQLGATNDRVTDTEEDISNLDSRVTTNEGDITNINTTIEKISSGSIGLVTYDDASEMVSVAAGKAGAMVNFAGTAGARVLTGVAAGELSKESTDAVNGAQLSTTNDRVADNEEDISDLDGRVTINEGDITNLDERMTINEGDISTINNQINEITAGTAGLVTHDEATGITSIATGKGGTVIDMGGTDGLRRLTGIADGVDAQDAVTMNQLRAVGMIDPTTGLALNVLTYDDTSLGRATLRGENGTVLDNVADGSIASGSREAINGGQLAGALEGLNQQFNDYRSWFEQTFDEHVAYERDSAGGASNGGQDAYNAENGSVAIGDGGGAGAGSIEVGKGASADGENQVAIGRDAKASADNSVAIGAGSTADRANSVAVGSAGNERVISHVADGVLPTDAVNVRQLNDRFEDVRSYTERRMHQVDKRIDGMAAMSGAYAGMALNTAGLKGHNRVGVGIGAQNGETAMAVGYQRILGKRDNISVSLGGAFSGNDTSLSAGAGFSW